MEWGVDPEMRAFATWGRLCMLVKRDDRPVPVWLKKSIGCKLVALLTPLHEGVLQGAAGDLNQPSVRVVELHHQVNRTRGGQCAYS